VRDGPGAGGEEDTVKERGILFGAPMIRALLAGAKTQTRRILKPFPTAALPGPSEAGPWDYLPSPNAKCAFLFKSWETKDKKGGVSIPIPRCPYGAAGDRLWVRETHAQFAVGDRTGTAPQAVAYRATCDADGGFEHVNNGDEIMRLKVTKWTPGIHMPRWASRITLEVTEVRVDRLQDISEEDARAEGPLFAIDQEQTVLFPHLTAERNSGCVACRGDGRGVPELCHDSLRGKGRPFACWYASVWDGINGDGSWEANPWVWAISFRRVEAAR
jgi:hypothetical protein